MRNIEEAIESIRIMHRTVFESDISNDDLYWALQEAVARHRKEMLSARLASWAIHELIEGMRLVEKDLPIKDLLEGMRLESTDAVGCQYSVEAAAAPSQEASAEDEAKTLDEEVSRIIEERSEEGVKRRGRRKGQ